MDWLHDRDALTAAHRRSLAMAARWRDGAAHRRWTAVLDGLHDAGARQAADAIAALFSDATAVAGLLAPLVTALRDDPAFEPPLRVQRDGLRTGAVLIDHPVATITASVTAAAALAQLPPAATVVVPGRMTVVRYHRAGSARLDRWRLEGEGCVADAPVRLRDGMVLQVDGRRHATMLADAACDVVALTAVIRAEAAVHMREHDRASGAPVRLATLDEGASRSLMLLSLLRLSGRADAAEAFEQATRAPAHHLRWAAMREWLALDIAAALPRLRSMAMGDPHDEVRAAASTMLPVVQARLAA